MHLLKHNNLSTSHSLFYEKSYLQIYKNFRLNNEFGEDDSGVKDASPEEMLPPGLSLAEVPDLLGPMVLCGNLFRSVCLDLLSSQLE